MNSLIYLYQEHSSCQTLNIGNIMITKQNIEIHFNRYCSSSMIQLSFFIFFNIYTPFEELRSKLSDHVCGTPN